MGVRLTPGTEIASYRILDFIASGGEGDVYNAVTPEGRPVVLKQLRESVSGPDGEVHAERARRVGRLVGAHHSCVCEILDVFAHRDLMYVVTERVEGDTLERLLLASGPMPLEVFALILEDLLAGLGWLHARGFVHRDVKPGNIMVRAEAGRYRAALIDLSIVFDRRLPRLTRKALGPGTYEYAPKEIIFREDEDIDGRADLYSAGATMFHALTGHLPFDASSCEALLKLCLSPERPSLRVHVPELSPTVDRYVQRLMALRATDRPASAEAAWAEFESLVGPAPSARRAPTRHPAPPATVAAGHGLRIESGSLAGVLLAVPRNGLTLGRSLVNPEDNAISRFHVRAAARDRGIRLRDLGSRNGLIVRDRRRRRAFLRPGERLVLGETSLTCV